MSRHLISRAAKLFAGAVSYARYQNGSPGLEVHAPYYHSFGAPLTLDANFFVDAATGAELPNNATTTYTPLTDGVSPLDNGDTVAPATVVMADGSSVLVWPLDVARNVTLAVTHDTSIVAMSILVRGYDVYGEAMSELLAVTATGTSKTAAGKKAFKWVSSIAITSAGNATANTANVGFGDVLGLPVRATSKGRVIPIGNGALDASATIVIADDTAATNATGDTRGTVDFNTASDATKLFEVWIMPASRDTKEATFGIAQA